MKSLIQSVLIAASLMFTACNLLMIEPDQARVRTPAAASAAEESGSVDMTVELEKTMALAKSAEISLTRLCINLSAAGVDSIFDTLKISGNAKILSSKTYTGLTAGKHWRLRVKSLDRKDSVVHTGTAVFEVQPRQTAKVSLQLNSRFTMLRAAFYPIKDSVNRCAIYLDDKIVADTVFSRKQVSGDTVFLPFDYLQTEVWHKIKLAAYGRIWGVDTVLYAGDTTVKTAPGVDAAFRLTLNGTGYAQGPNGAVAMEVSMGKVARLSVQGELKDITAHSGLVLHMPLNGNAQDISDFANHGTLGGARPGEDRFGRKEGAMAFDGIDDSILVPTAPSLCLKEALTLSAWVKMDSSKSHMLMAKSHSFYMYGYGWGYQTYIGNGANGNPTTSGVTTAKAWTHLVLTWDGLTAKIYENGALKAEVANRGHIYDYSRSDLVIGAAGMSGWKQHYLRGSLDDIRIYNRGLSSEDVANLHKIESAKP